MDNTTAQHKPGALLIGSLPLPDTATAFRKCGAGLPDRLHCVPDGETGPRWYFIMYQRGIFKDFPHVLTSFEGDYDPMRLPRAQKDEQDEVLQKWLEENRPMDVMYDKYAIESYQTFKQLRDVEKVFGAQTRFQVTLPSPTNMIGCMIMPQYRAQVDPFYTEGLVSALHNIQKSIPPSDLTIQIDMAVDMAIIEHITSTWWNLEEMSLFDGVVARGLSLASAVHPDAKLGFHICYGDVEHQHFLQPKDLGSAVKVIISLMQKCSRKIDYVHVPVPIDREDEAYFSALAEFEKANAEHGHATTLYLGLVHAKDPEGTKRRIAAAKKVVTVPFGVATECGMGRTASEDLDGILEIMKEHTAPVSKTEASSKQPLVILEEVPVSGAPVA